MKRKALFFDIDGTLLVDASKELPKSAALALTEARRAGHLVFINSGRTRCLMKDVEGKVPVDGYLCGCGTYIEAEGKALLHRKISAKRRWELQKAILECKLDGILEGPKACTVQTGVSHMDEIEHVKMWSTRTRAWPARTGIRSWWILISSVFLRTRTVTRKVFKDPGTGRDRHRPGTRTLRVRADGVR